MSTFDKAKDKAEQAVGAAKEKMGGAMGNEDMQNSGKADQTKGEVSEAGHDVRDKTMGAAQDAKDKFSDN
jgi:uncharacterized protein YjbJ (UPF0337 family)